VPHRVHQRKFGRQTGHRKAMLRNLTLSVLRYESVKTTEAKAKEVRTFIDGMIVLGKDGSLVARRKALGWLPEREIVEKLFTDLATRYADRQSGFTRTTRLPRRVGDSAPMMLIELMPGVEETVQSEAEAKPRRRLALPRRKTTAAASSEGGRGEAPAKKKTTARGGKGGAPAKKKTVKAKA
jgi:large subunit ribosomal protein L17